AGIRPGAVRPDGDPLERIDPGDRPAAGADFDHLDNRNAQRQPASLLESVDPRHLEGAASLRLEVVDQADFRGSAAHVVAEHLIKRALPRDMAPPPRAPP